MFTDEIGRHRTIDNLRRALDSAVRDAGLPRIRLHDLRHTHASLMIGTGVAMKVVQERLGHSSYVVTADYYSPIAADMHDTAAEMLGNALRRQAV